MFVSSFMFIALFAIGLAHFIWALGRTWPIRDRKLLAQTVVGTADIESVPRLPSLLIALFAFGAGSLRSPSPTTTAAGCRDLAGYGFALLFLGRGPWAIARAGGSAIPSRISSSTTRGSIPRSACSLAPALPRSHS